MERDLFLVAKFKVEHIDDTLQMSGRSAVTRITTQTNTPWTTINFTLPHSYTHTTHLLPPRPPPTHHAHLLLTTPTSCSPHLPLAHHTHLLLTTPTSCSPHPPPAHHTHLLLTTPTSCPPHLPPAHHTHLLLTTPTSCHPTHLVLIHTLDHCTVPDLIIRELSSIDCTWHSPAHLGQGAGRSLGQ